MGTCHSTNKRPQTPLNKEEEIKQEAAPVGKQEQSETPSSYGNPVYSQYAGEVSVSERSAAMMYYVVLL
jgi:hypothetical protein